MKTCLVLEGGALRGLYTCGVLDYFLDNNIDVDCIIGVSAGALFGVNYFSKQRGRGLRYNLKYCNDKRYISIWSLLFTGNIVNKNFAYYKLTKKLDVFDEEAFEKANKDFYATVTNLESGKPEYIKVSKPIEEMEVLRASSAMPLYSKIVEVSGNKYLDGAVGDSIPVKKAIEMGYDKIIVVLTQPSGYKKKELTEKELKKFNSKYKKYPLFLTSSINRPKMYNETLDYISKLEKDKRIFVIRPSSDVSVNPVKKTRKRLQEVYDIGFNDVKELFKELKRYLSSKK